MKPVTIIAAFAGAASAQNTAGPWAQCGGSGWTGPTVCQSGYTCTVSNEWYSQCLPGTATLTTTTRTTTTNVPQPTSAGFRWFGVGESVAEFGQDTYPGVWGKNFRFPDPATITVSRYLEVTLAEQYATCHETSLHFTDTGYRLLRMRE
jgi:endoglucanase